MQEIQGVDGQAMETKQNKSYSGDLMQKGIENEEIILKWLKGQGHSIIDFREFRLAQRIDVDFGIETVDGNILLAEIKSDKMISELGNLCFEVHRINHFVKDKWFYLGWGWRSPAQKLIIRNPASREAFVFDFMELRTQIGKYIDEIGNRLRTNITQTDKQKTTFNWIIPMSNFTSIYKKHII